VKEYYKETESGSLKFKNDQTARQAIKKYSEKNDLYSQNLGPHVDRVYRNHLIAPFGKQLVERVGEVLDPDSKEVREEIKTIIEEQLEP
jgi:type VI protein secretion system component VasK